MMITIRSPIQIITLMLIFGLSLFGFWAQTNLFNNGETLTAECVGTINGGYLMKRNGYIWIYFTKQHFDIFQYYAFHHAYWHRSRFNLELYRNQYLGIIHCCRVFKISSHNLLQFIQKSVLTIHNWCKHRYQTSPIINKLFFNVNNANFENQNGRLGINYIFCLSMIHLLVLIKVKDFFIKLMPSLRKIFEILFYAYLLLFVFLETNSIPYYRAFAFLIMRKFAKIFGWKHNSAAILVISAALMLFLNLMVIFNYGFFLSYLYAFVILIVLKYRKYRLKFINKVLLVWVIFIVSFLVQSWMGSGYSFVQLLIQPILILLISVMVLFFFIGFWISSINTMISIYAIKIIPHIIKLALHHNALICLDLSNWDFFTAFSILIVILLQYNKHIKKHKKYLIYRKKILSASIV